ncbi:hypothetical protein Tco_1191791 [Tanacetum coccineum]
MTYPWSSSKVSPSNSLESYLLARLSSYEQLGWNIHPIYPSITIEGLRVPSIAQSVASSVGHATISAVISKTSGRTVGFEGILERAPNGNGRIAEERIWEVSNGRTCNEGNMEDLVPTTYKALMEKTYTWIEAKEMVMNGAPVKYMEGFDKLARNTSDILATEKVAKDFNPPPRMTAKGKNKDMSKYCQSHKDHGHNTDYCRELKRQTEEAYRSGKLAHLVKGIRKGKAKASDTQQGNWKKSDKYNNFSEASILMIRQSYPKRKFVKQEVHGVRETTFPPVIDKAPSTDPVVWFRRDT